MWWFCLSTYLILGLLGFIICWMCLVVAKRSDARDVANFVS